MYPLYGLCARLRAPVVLEITSREQWAHYRPQVEVVAADFPEMEIVLAPPQGTDADSIIQLIQHFPHISFLPYSQEFRAEPMLCEYVEVEGREHTLFRSSPDGWAEAEEEARRLPLGLAARRAYLGENAMRLFKFPVEAAILEG